MSSDSSVLMCRGHFFIKGMPRPSCRFVPEIPVPPLYPVTVTWTVDFEKHGQGLHLLEEHSIEHFGEKGGLSFRPWGSRKSVVPVR